MTAPSADPEPRDGVPSNVVEFTPEAYPRMAPGALAVARQWFVGHACGAFASAAARRGRLGAARPRLLGESGSSYRSNARLADMNLHVERVDDRRLEVVANGSPSWGRQQLAVDTTLTREAFWKEVFMMQTKPR